MSWVALAPVAATAVAAIILAHAPTTFVAILVFIQTLLILGVVMLLEQHPIPPAQKSEIGRGTGGPSVSLRIENTGGPPVPR